MFSAALGRGQPVAPAITSVMGIGSRVEVLFSVPVEAMSAVNLTNYALSNWYGNVSVQGAVFGTNSQIVELTTAAQLPFLPHWLAVNGVADALTGTNVIAPGSQGIYTNIGFTTGYIEYDLFQGITSTNLMALTNNANYPSNPSKVEYLDTTYWYESGIGANYGSRMTGILVPPVSGEYELLVYSQGYSQLSLGTNESPASARVIASTPTFYSAGITLQAGQPYFIEALTKEGSSPGDVFEAGWLRPGSNDWELIEGDYLGGYLTDSNATITIRQQPANASVNDNRSATFTVSATGSSRITTNVNYQWQCNGVNIPGATSATYTTPLVYDTNSGSLYRVLAFVPGAARMSSSALLTVTQDLVPPTVLQAMNFNLDTVRLLFSEAIDPASATNLANYAFIDGLAITRISLDASNTTVTLTTGPLVYGSNYTLVVNGVRDQAMVPNIVATNTLVQFLASSSISQDIGGPLASTTTVLTNGVAVAAAGRDIGGTADQFTFNYQLCSGDFDMSVRLEGLSLSDVWAKAGLMARETLSPNSRFVAALATPSLNGAFFEYRSAISGTSVSQGGFPVNYPNTWLRLQRMGTSFTGYASYDGLDWTPLSSASIAMSNLVYIGVAACSHNSSQWTTAQFRDFANVQPGVTVGPFNNPHDALGPSSRKTPIAISEIMYKPASRADGYNVEFIELYNSNPWFHDIGGYQIVADNLQYTVPLQTTIPGGGFLVIAASPSSMQALYGITNVLGPYAGSLKASGTLQLLDEHGAVLLTVPYSNVYPWPVAADGTGHSLVLANPTYGEEDPRAWDISDVVGGSPGALESFRPDPLRNVVINEILAHTENPAVPDFIELYNHSALTNNLSGCILTDDAAVSKFVIPSGTLIGPGGFVSFERAQLGFGLRAEGETVYLLKPDRSRVLDAVQFEAQADGVSYGRWPDGASAFYALAARTPGAANSPISISDIVINELMYDPLSGNDNDQFIELYNQGTNPVSLANWQFTSGVTFTFPTNVTLAPDGYLVLARNLTNLFAKYTNLNIGNTLGNFSGKLSHSGERVALARPQLLNGVTTLYVVEDEVTYGTGGRWGHWAAGGGSSLELIDPRGNHRLAANWADSDDTQKSSWVNIETTGVLNNGQNYSGGISYAQLGLLDVGECLVDNVEVRSSTAGANLVKNPDFENGLTNWSLQGCMVRSSLENSGYASSRSLHIRCSSRLWTGANSCQMALNANSLGLNQTATLRFKARWLHGWPEIALRLNGNWLEAAGALPVPPNLGTPGAPNSRRVANAGPALYEVTHTPSLPAENQDVLVTARVHDPDGVQSITLNYRYDGSTYSQTLPMLDDGSGGDGVAGDGVFSATIPGQYSGAIITFFVSATDRRGVSSRFPALVNDNAPERECVVMFGDGNPGGSFGVYHLWVTQTNADLWNSLPILSNEMIDGTFVCGNRVIYNMQGRYAGSPYHQDFYYLGYYPAHYKWDFPDDDKLFGATSFDKIHAPGNGAGDDGTFQCEQSANMLLRALGVPWLNRRYVALYINGSRPVALMEDAQTPDGDLVKEYFPNDTDGYLYKMQPWFEFAPSSSSTYLDFVNCAWCNLMPYPATGLKKVPRYRYNFEIRRTPGSMSDFTNVFSLVDAAGAYTTANYVANMQNLADMENWMRVFAANHAAGNWDSFGAQNAQNLYGYLGAQGTKYSLLMFDFNIALGNGGSWSPGANLFTVNSQDPNTASIYNNPAFRRMYLRALQELVNGPLSVANSGPLLDAKYNAFVANGLSAQNSSTIKSWLASAQSSIASQISPQTSVAFTVNSPPVISGNAINVTGSAPVAVKTIWFNGIEYPVTWTSVTTWRATVPLQPGTNLFNVVGVNRAGQPLPGASGSAFAVYNATSPSPLDRIVLNEIMFHPTAPGGQYVELYNTSTSLTFDLSAWQMQGLSYTFPAGSLLGPTNYLILAADRTAFAGAYGARLPIFDTFAPSLPASGETLALVQPGAGGASNIMAEVRYESTPPWPAGADGQGSSLQLIDPRQDNWRVANWAGSFPPASRSPAAANPVSASLPAFPPLWLNELQADNLTGITNSAGERGGWLELYNPTTNLVSLSNLCLSVTYTNLAQWSFPANAVIAPSEFKVVFADGQVALSSSNELHTSFTLSSGAGALVLSQFDTNGQSHVLDYLNYTNLGPNHSYGSFPDGQSFVRQEFFYATPGTSNDGGKPLPVAINEWMAGNTHTITNPIGGKYDDWFELYNYGSNAVDLAGCYLTHSLTNPVEFQIPPGYAIPAHGFLLVWADKETPTGSGDLHANFKLTKSGTSIGLYWTNASLMDYVTFGQQTSDLSMGRYPDGGPAISILPTATPRTNNAAPNTAPVLLPLASQFIYLGQTLTLTAHADDADLPSQRITYSLDAGAPTNATMNPTNGLFSWAPLPRQAPSTNLIPLLASDDGIPPLGTRQAFLVTVALPPKLGVASVNGNQLAFAWPTFPGQTYQIEYKDNLNDLVWIPLSVPLPGNGALLALTNYVGGSPHRFFRLKVPPLGVLIPVPLPRLDVTLTSNQFVFTWPTLLGQSYEIEYCDDLGAGFWAPSGDAIAGTGALLTLTNQLALPNQRFYRLKLLPQ
jgi:regulation of enolase protein 1 (concanavalin A-like superfamily)